MDGSTDWLVLSSQALLELALVLVGTLLLLKWLILRRLTMVGVTLARNNLFMAIAYYTAAVSARVPFFRGVPWRLTITTLVIITAAHAFWEIVQFYGGWRGTLLELRISLLELLVWWLGRPEWLVASIRRGADWARTRLHLHAEQVQHIRGRWRSQ